jgi:hypothetical protein
VKYSHIWGNPAISVNFVIVFKDMQGGIGWWLVVGGWWLVVGGWWLVKL